MLCISVRQEESVYIGPDIVVKVLAVKGSSATLGIDAPRDVPVYREEVLRKIEAEKRRAALEGELPKPSSKDQDASEED